MKKGTWTSFWLFQLKSAALAVVGWVLLLPLAVLWRWTTGWKRNSALPLDWRWQWIDDIWGNAEDGIDPGPKLVVNGRDPYMLGKPVWLRIYLWTAWRNSTNNLRWSAVRSGPWWQRRWRGWYAQAGYRPDNGWPVLSAGKGKGTQI